MRPGTNATTLLERLVRRHANLPLGYIKDWSEHSFKFDAISILAILGSGEVDQAVGTLIRRRYTDCLPLLAGQVIASNSFTSSLPGFTMFDMSNRYKRTELNESFARILMFVPTTQATTILTWKPVEHEIKSRLFGIDILSVVLSFFVISPLLACTIFMADWYGVCNACAIIVSVLCRILLVSQLRHGRDMNTRHSMRPSSDDAVNRSIIIRPDSRMITCIAPIQLTEGLFRSNQVEHRLFYKMTRRLAWLSLSVHLCTLNMCTLFSQIYTIALLGLSTWIMNSAWAFDTGRTVVSNMSSGDDTEKTYRFPYSEGWDLHVTLPPRFEATSHGYNRKQDRRAVAWARLHLNQIEESLLIRWDFMPQRHENREWWYEYQKLKDEFPHAEIPVRTAPNIQTILNATASPLLYNGSS